MKEKIEKLIEELKLQKLNDRSEKDRLWAIAITDAEKLLAFVIYAESK